MEYQLIPVMGRRPRYRFPVCAITKNGCAFMCYLNRKADDMTYEMEACGVNWFHSKDGKRVYCIPSKSMNAYAPCFAGDMRKGYSIPKDLVTKGIVKLGHYRIEKYKGGFMFDTEKTLEEETDEQ